MSAIADSSTEGDGSRGCLRAMDYAIGITGGPESPDGALLVRTPAQPGRREAAGSSWLWKQCAGVAWLWPLGKVQGTEGAGREACSLAEHSRARATSDEWSVAIALARPRAISEAKAIASVMLLSAPSRARGADDSGRVQRLL